MLFTQLTVTQSDDMRHTLPTAQGGQVLPPQSMSVSLPFFRWSVQLGAAHALLSQTALEQSLLRMHIFPGSHLGQVSPPQSTSASSSSLTPSMQLRAKAKA